LLLLQRLQLSGGDQAGHGVRAQAHRRLRPQLRGPRRRPAAHLALLPPQGRATQGCQALLPPQGHGQERAEPFPAQSQVLLPLLPLALINFFALLPPGLSHCSACVFKIPCNQYDALLLRCLNKFCFAFFFYSVQICIVPTFRCLPVYKRWNGTSFNSGVVHLPLKS
jgi:hypothetical protein